MIDVTSQINTVRREVGARVLEAGEARVVTISREFGASIEAPGPSGRAMDPAESASWVASEKAKRFMSLSSGRWCDASIAAGTDEATAQAAAVRTIAAYTGTAEGR